MKLSIKEIALFPLFGALMFISKLLTEFLPNVHLIAMFVVVFTVVFRAKALIPIYIFVFLIGFSGGFSLWWVPYLYIWTVLWGAIMLLPKNMGKKTSVIVYMLTAALHGLCYGTLYAPFQAIAFGLDFKGTVAWIIAGLPWDFIHCAGNFAVTVLAVPLINTLKKALKYS